MELELSNFNYMSLFTSRVYYHETREGYYVSNGTAVQKVSHKEFITIKEKGLEMIRTEKVLTFLRLLDDLEFSNLEVSPIVYKKMEKRNSRMYTEKEFNIGYSDGLVILRNEYLKPYIGKDEKYLGGIKIIASKPSNKNNESVIIINDEAIVSYYSRKLCTSLYKEVSSYLGK